MRHSLLATAILCLASCGAPYGVTRVEIPPPNLPPAQVKSTESPVVENEEATMDFLQLQIDMSTSVRSPVEPEIRYVDRVIYGGRYGESETHRRSHRRSTFPLRTAFGAGLGAIIGHQSGHRGGGAAIGAGVGLLLDLMSW